MKNRTETPNDIPKCFSFQGPLLGYFRKEKQKKEDKQLIINTHLLEIEKDSLSLFLDR